MKKPKTLKDIFYCYTGYCDSMCIKQSTPMLKETIIDWILYLRQPEKERKRTLQISHRKWLKEMHQEGYNEYAIMLFNLPSWHKESRAQVKILKKIFNITEKEIKEHGNENGFND